jgi:hypothetical protein
MTNFIKGFIVIGLLAMLETAYASCTMTTIFNPNGTVTICQICNDGRMIICN